jgi:hypothetical protein
MTLQTHHADGTPINITKLKLWQRRQLYAKMCEGKQQFFSERHAMVRIHTLIDEKLDGGVELCWYICPFCLAWHIGHKPWDTKVPYEMDEVQK